MSDEQSDTVDVVEARLDGELIAESPLPDDDVPAGADSAGAVESDAAGPDVEAAETPQEQYRRLLAEGYKPWQLTAITNARGTLIEVRIL